MTINGIGEASAKKIVEFRMENSISSWQVFHDLAPQVQFAEMARLHQAGEWNSYIKVFKIGFDHTSKATIETHTVIDEIHQEILKNNDATNVKLALLEDRARINTQELSDRIEQYKQEATEHFESIEKKLEEAKDYQSAQWDRQKQHLEDRDNNLGKVISKLSISLDNLTKRLNIPFAEIKAPDSEDEDDPSSSACPPDTKSPEPKPSRIPTHDRKPSTNAVDSEERTFSFKTIEKAVDDRVSGTNMDRMSEAPRDVYSGIGRGHSPYLRGRSRGGSNKPLNASSRPKPPHIYPNRYSKDSQKGYQKPSNNYNNYSNRKDSHHSPSSSQHSSSNRAYGQFDDYDEQDFGGNRRQNRMGYAQPDPQNVNRYYDLDNENDSFSDYSPDEDPDERRPQGYSMDARNIRLDPFDGKMGQWESWFHKFKFIARNCNWTNREKLFRLTTALTGRALTTHMLFPEETRNNFRALCRALKKKYGKMRKSTKASLRDKLSSVKQKDSEDLDEFSDRVYMLAVDAHPNDMPRDILETYAVEAFLNGCRDSNAAWLVKCMQAPETMFDAVEHMRLTHSTGQRMGIRLGGRQVTFDDNSTSETPSRVRRLENSSPDACHGCGGIGHYARDCPTKRNRSTSPVRCYECGGRGHISMDCGNHKTKNLGDSPRNFRRTDRSPSPTSQRFEPRGRRDQRREDEPQRNRYTRRSDDGSNSPNRRDQRREDEPQRNRYSNWNRENRRSDEGSNSPNWRSTMRSPRPQKDKAQGNEKKREGSTEPAARAIKEEPLN